MTSNMSAEDSAQSLGGILPSRFQTHVTYFLKNSQLYAGGLMKNISRTGASVQNIIHFITHPAPRPQIVTPEDSSGLELQPVVGQQVIDTAQDPESTQETTLCNRNSPIHEVDGSGQASQPASVIEYDSNEDPSAHPKRSWMWAAAVLIVVLVLIMLPGLILGFVTRQVAWGIAISGAFAPLAVFLGSLYYHHNK